MSYADLYSLEEFLQLLHAHKNTGYLILFSGAFFETLIPFSLFIYGELFFISGSVLAGTGALDIWTVAVVFYAGGILGDNASYWLGKIYGLDFLENCSRWPLIKRWITESTRAKGISFFRRHGKFAVFWARLSGPFSWFVPVLAGAFQHPYRQFVIFNTLGVLIGIGQFLLLGYLLGNNLDMLLIWLRRLGCIPLTIITILLSALLWYRFQRRKQAATTKDE
ncbi:MAG: DedA family protein [Desulfopila sp.]|jgi:membrane-associated protein|nr:DedA family protein [Desulfopila sp.]